jgi:hypothetical protein
MKPDDSPYPDVVSMPRSFLSCRSDAGPVNS